MGRTFTLTTVTVLLCGIVALASDAPTSPGEGIVLADGQLLHEPFGFTGQGTATLSLTCAEYPAGIPYLIIPDSPVTVAHNARSQLIHVDALNAYRTARTMRAANPNQAFFDAIRNSDLIVPGSLEEYPNGCEVMFREDLDSPKPQKRWIGIPAVLPEDAPMDRPAMHEEAIQKFHRVMDAGGIVIVLNGEPIGHANYEGRDRTLHLMDVLPHRTTVDRRELTQSAFWNPDVLRATFPDIKLTESITVED
ncbi:MAG: hypothetical protein QF819_09200 [Gemmatimonadota bacterium]|jgi:hypothetical protein|nr:hypothetical protein [Gemmatimonadota bacterium]MDP6803326.1 hypothetical protein [Gemmatimonadota bacterium]MDP7032333.1 hypothetical protein [Gemmatimonadota bacterium]